SSGLGWASAQQLVAEGARVVLVARRAELLRQRINELGGDQWAAALPADLTDPETADAACELALQRFGRLDGALISVAGPAKGTVLEVTDDQWRDAFELVFLAAMRSLRAVVGHAASATSIAFVLSSSAKTPLAEMAPSNGLRPGLAMLVKQASDELAPQGHRVLGLLPGLIATDRLASLFGPDPQQAMANAAAGIPARRIADPAEFGRVAAFCVSPAASYLTGSLIAVDGGSLRVP
ncbi:MAG: SDR family oxidoreductase, partial [Arachnia sp.]